eukprot:Lankesteria_metandrocarpae@DN287_c0_g1_i1.p1
MGVQPIESEGGCWSNCRPHGVPDDRSTANKFICFGILSLVFPGVGAMALSCSGGDKRFCKIGVLQLVLAIIVYGWIWSFVYGMYMISAGCSYSASKVQKFNEV